MKVYSMSWAEVHSRLEAVQKTIPPEFTKVYGVPKGGMILSAFLKPGYQVVHQVEDADFILDDIVDSGTTRALYDKLEIPFFTLVDKLGNDQNMPWIQFPWEEKTIDIEANVTRLLQGIGEDVHREGLVETPARVAKSFLRLYGGYNQNPEDVLKTFDEEDCHEMVVLRDIEFYSTCEHHMLPFMGKAHIGYIPNGKVVGISKLARLLEIFARRLQIQERIGKQITQALMKSLAPQGCGVVLEAQHMCMTSRGVEKQNSIMMTASMAGSFLMEPHVKQEFMGMIGK